MFDVYDRKGNIPKYTITPTRGVGGRVWNRTPYGVVAVPKEILPSHSSIFGKSFSNLLLSIATKTEDSLAVENSTFTANSSAPRRSTMTDTTEGRTMKRRIALAAVLVALIGTAAAVSTQAAGAKLPKCSAVKCRDIGCPADVLCASGTTVKTCADVCNGH